jgi:hypothetical protein
METREKQVKVEKAKRHVERRVTGRPRRFNFVDSEKDSEVESAAFGSN